VVLNDGFQSSPALSSGRYQCRRVCNLDPTVSILARPFERALRVLRVPFADCEKFQSSPALSSGRYQSSWL